MQEVINEILSGRRIIYPEVDIAPIVLCRGLTGPEKVNSQIYYKMAYDDGLKNGLEPEEILRASLQKNGDWTMAHDRLLIDIDSRIKDLSNRLQDLTYRVSEKKATLGKIDKLKKQKDQLTHKKFMLFSNSAEFYANEIKYFWNFHKMIYLPGGALLWADFAEFQNTDVDIVTIIIHTYIKDFLISQKQIREIARSGLWRVYFTSCKNSKDLFDKPLCDLDDNQLNLLYWSNVYDNAFNAYEPPDDETVIDDDAFDGWLDSYAEKTKKDRASSSLSKNVKGGSGREQMFVMTDDEGAKKLYNDMGPPVLDI